jgi:hypothetical protein
MWRSEFGMKGIYWGSFLSYIKSIMDSFDFLKNDIEEYINRK